MNDLMLNKVFEDENTYSKLERFSKVLASSDFAPKDYRGKPANIIIAVIYGSELGLPPMQAIQNIAIINGRPSIYGDLALALVRNNPDCISVTESMEGSIKEKNAVCICTVERKNETIERRFTYEQAAKACLLGKPGPWQQYPERMLQMRARGFALRDSFPDILKGLHLQEEMEGSDLKFVSPKIDENKVQRKADVITHTPAETEEDKRVKEKLIADLEILLSELNRSEERINQVLQTQNADKFEDLSIKFLNVWISKLNEEKENVKKELLEKLEWLFDYTGFSDNDLSELLEQYKVQSLNQLSITEINKIMDNINSNMDYRNDDSEVEVV